MGDDPSGTTRPGNKVQNNTADGNIGDGIEISAETDDQVQNNATNGNENDGILVSGGQGGGSGAGKPSGGGNQLQNNTSEGNMTFDLEDDYSCGINTWQNDIFFTSSNATTGSCIN
ncbi:MAG: hypothetical protein WCD57_08610 [Acidobacteriaceae bacterium]